MYTCIKLYVKNKLDDVGVSSNLFWCVDSVALIKHSAQVVQQLTYIYSYTNVRPIAVGEVLCCLTSRICCSVVRPCLVDILVIYGQVGVEVKGGLEAAIHATRCCLHHYGSDLDLCLLKLEMRNTFNECDQSVFFKKVKACLPELYDWAQWCYVFPTELRFGRRQILSLSGVPLWGLLFSLVLASLFD